jgi:hypothetical protein
MSYFTVKVPPAGRQVDLTVQLASRDLYEALALDTDRDPSDAEILAGRARLAAYVIARVEVEGDGRRCPLGLDGLDIVTQADRFARLRLHASCPGEIGRLGLGSELFFDLDPAHIAFITITAGDRELRRELRADHRHLTWDLAGAMPASLGPLDFVGEGIHHIFTGYDHIVFIIGLLLAALISGAGTLSLQSGLAAVLKTVTAFTIAHSLTLIAAALGWLTLPSRVVESAIAASIVYVAVENLLLRVPRPRWPVAFAFGLVHGLGFASALAPLLPPTGRVAPLLAFNGGVELGQLAIVVVLLPVLWVVLSRLGLARYRRWVLGLGSAMVALLGLFWLVERLLDLKILPALG